MSKIYQKSISCHKKRAKRRNGGFTLLELLVVVLIIGILAAVALPQYQTAVLKSRAAEMLLLGKAVQSAQKVYYMANGTLSADLTALDIALPAGFEVDAQNPSLALRRAERVKQGVEIELDNEKVRVRTQDRKLSYYFFINQNEGAVYCTAQEGNAWEKVCKSQGTFGGSGWYGPGMNTYIIK